MVTISEALMRQINDRAYAVANDADDEVAVDDLAELALDGLSVDHTELSDLIAAHGYQAVVSAAARRLSF